MAKYDFINPDHYKREFKGLPIEVADVADTWNLSRWEFAALKHLLRDGKPGQDRIQDLDKLIWYAEREKQILLEERRDGDKLDS